MAQTVYDVVCGMSTELGEWDEKVEYNGKTYYFCSKTCKETFDKDPKKSAEPKQTARL